MGEEPAQAIVREITEEAGIKVGQPQLVFIENAPEPYGTQYIYLCPYVEGELKLDPTSVEAKINELGDNLYQPVWRKLSELSSLELRSPRLKQALLAGLAHGFPAEPIDITNAQPV